MANISAHAYFICLDCHHTSERDFFDMSDPDDYPDHVHCESCGSSMAEDGADVWIDGEQVEARPFGDAEGDDECPNCGAELDERDDDLGECGDCGEAL